MGSSGGGGTTTSTQQSSFPEEFQPLVESAVPEIQKVQQALPLVDFTQSNPQGVAPLSQFQSDVFSLLPNLLQNTQGLNVLQSLAGPANQLLGNIGQVGGGTGGAQAALNALAASGRVGASSLQAPLAAPQIQNFGVQPSVVPGAGLSTLGSRF